MNNLHKITSDHLITDKHWATAYWIKKGGGNQDQVKIFGNRVYPYRNESFYLWDWSENDWKHVLLKWTGAGSPKTDDLRRLIVV